MVITFAKGFAAPHCVSCNPRRSSSKKMFVAVAAKFHHGCNPDVGWFQQISIVVVARRRPALARGHRVSNPGLASRGSGHPWSHRLVCWSQHPALGPVQSGHGDHPTRLRPLHESRWVFEARKEPQKWQRGLVLWSRGEVLVSSGASGTR